MTQQAAALFDWDTIGAWPELARFFNMNQLNCCSGIYPEILPCYRLRL